MSLGHILLGMLREPASGWDLGQHFDRGARFYWRADLSQIYPALSKLEAEGWVKGRVEKSPIGPDRRVYRITRAGRQELKSWLRSGPLFRTERLAHVAQLIFMDELGDPDETLRFVEEMRDQISARLSSLKAIEAHILRDSNDWEAMTDAEFNQYAALRQGIAVVAARKEWCAETSTRLKRRGTFKRPPGK